MEDPPMSILDMGVIALFALGALFGLLLGFVRGGLFILSWLGSGIATIFGFSYAQPYGHQFIENDFFADLAAGGAVFLITLILLFLLSSFIGGWVRKSRLNALDRSLGMLAGLATAALLITGGYVIAENMWTDKPPVWMTKARTLPLIRTSAGLLNQLLPQTFKVEGLKSLDKITGETRENLEKKAYEELLNPRNKKSDIQDREGYDSKERKAMERLLQGR